MSASFDTLLRYKRWRLCRGSTKDSYFTCAYFCGCKMTPTMTRVVLLMIRVALTITSSVLQTVSASQPTIGASLLMPAPMLYQLHWFASTLKTRIPKVANQAPQKMSDARQETCASFTTLVQPTNVSPTNLEDSRPQSNTERMTNAWGSPSTLKRNRGAERRRRVDLHNMALGDSSGGHNPMEIRTAVSKHSSSNSEHQPSKARKEHTLTAHATYKREAPNTYAERHRAAPKACRA